MSLIEKYSDLPECTPIYKQCKESDCESCGELACPVNVGKVSYVAVEPLMRRFVKLKEETSMYPKLFYCPFKYKECERCTDESCGVWHGMVANDPVMFGLLTAKWQLFWLDCQELLLPEKKAELYRQDVIFRIAINSLEKWKEEYVLEEKLKEYGLDFSVI